MATAIELHEDDVEHVPEREIPTHPSGKVTGWDEESGLPIVKRAAHKSASNEGEKHEVTHNPHPPVHNAENRETVQGSSDPEAIRASAAEQEPKLEHMAEKVADSVPGAKVAGVRVKEADSQANKAERGKPAETNIDNLGARVAVDKPEDLKNAKKAAKEHLPVVDEDKIEGNGLDAPQLAVKTGEPGDANQVSELQLITKDQDKAMADTRGLYEKQKEALAKGDKAESDRIGAEIEKVHKAANPKEGGSGKPEHESAASKHEAADSKGGKMDAEGGDGKHDSPARERDSGTQAERRGRGTDQADSVGKGADIGNGSKVPQAPSRNPKSEFQRNVRTPDINTAAKPSGPANGSGKDSGNQVSKPSAVSSELSIGTRVTLPSGQAATVAYIPAKGAQLPTYRFKTDEGKTVTLRASEVGKVKPAEKPTGWTGIDLDGSLATYDGWKGPEHIGKPIPMMVDRVKRMLSQGHDVRVFTARVADDPDGSVEKRIGDWTEKHVGTRLPVTNVKDQHMTSLYDDRAIQVQRNHGRIMGSRKQAVAETA